MSEETDIHDYPVDGEETVSVSVDPASFNRGASDNNDGVNQSENPYNKTFEPLQHSSWLKGWNFNKENS